MRSLALRCFVVWAALGSGIAVAQSPDAKLSQEDRIAELERTVGVLSEELERTRVESAVPEDGNLESRYGLGPAASKIYGALQGLSLGGYAEGSYRAIVSDANGEKNSADVERVVLYAGYRFTENIVFNTEIEFENATTEETASSGPGSVSVEFATLDYLFRPWANARAGLMLIPMGFLNQIHEPPYYLGVNRPEVERRLIPTTWSETGAGVFGEIAEQVEYKLYVTNGLNAKGFDADGIREGRQKGNEAIAENFAFTGRLDWTPLPGLVVGASAFAGKAGQDQEFTVTGFPDVRLPSAFTALWDIHAQYEWRGLHLRGLFTMTHINDAGALSVALGPEAGGGIGVLDAGEAVANEMLGGYAEVSYDVLQWLLPDSERTLRPFFRYEYVNTQYDVPSGFVADDSKELNIYTVGLQFTPISNVVLKLDYRNKVAAQGSAPDEVNVGIGLAF